MRWTALLLWLLFLLVPAGQAWVRTELVPSLDEELQQLDTWRPPTVCRVFDRHGEPFDEFALVRRDWIDIEELPDVAWQAVVAAEDRRYFEHGGVDFLGILRAVWVNARAGDIREGGSTLTQQLVKNLVVGSERSYERKFHEALLAWRLEGRLGKRRVLELYLNYVYLGSGNYGIEAAAKDYFGVSARDLNAGQASLLAGLIPAPSAYSPRRRPEVAAKRRRLVLDAMVDMGFVDVLDAQWLKKRPVDPPRREDGESALGLAYATSVRREVRRLLGEKVPFDAGLQVYTPYDPKLQAVAEKAIEDTARALEQRQGTQGAIRRVVGEDLRAYIDTPSGLVMGDEGWLPPEPGACFEAVYLGKGKVTLGPFQWAFSQASWWGRVRSEDFEVEPRSLKETARWGDVFRVCLDPAGTVSLPIESWVEGAAVVMEHATGRIVAMVGGRTMPIEGFHRATQAARQAGSSFKPYVYAAALERGRTQIDTMQDEPLYLNAGNGQIWSPKNSSGRYMGRVPMRTAFALSLNTVAVRLTLEGGADAVVDLARAAGIQSRLRRDATIALGTSEVNVLEHAVGLSMFPNGGRTVVPVLVDRLVDVYGDEVGWAGAPVRLPEVDVTLPGGVGKRVVSPATAWQVVEMMRGVVTEGTGRRAFDPKQFRAGKTGTTSGFADAWFVGFTPEHTLVVWVGRDDRRTLGFNEVGGRAALPAWKAIADALTEDPASKLSPPSDVLFLPWADRWVGVAADDVPAARLGWHPPGIKPLSVFPGDAPPTCAAP